MWSMSFFAVLFLAKDRGGFPVAICANPGVLVEISHIAARHAKREHLFMLRGMETQEGGVGSARLGENVTASPSADNGKADF